MPRFIGSNTPPTTAEPFNSGVSLSGLSDAVSGLVFSDVAGTLFIEQSANQTDWDFVVEVPVTAGEGEGFKQELFAPYYRIRFEPDTDGAEFRLAARQFNAGRN